MSSENLTIAFEWDTSRAALTRVSEGRATFEIGKAFGAERAVCRPLIFSQAGEEEPVAAEQVGWSAM